MGEISPRLALGIRAAFGHHAGAVLERLETVDRAVARSRQDPERMFAAVIRLAAGRLDRLDQALELARRDWRDLLVAADLADEAWPSRLSAWLGPFDRTETASPGKRGELVEADGRRWVIRRRRIDLRVVRRLIHRTDVVVLLGRAEGSACRRITVAERRSTWEAVRRAYAGPGGPDQSIGGRGYLGHEFVGEDGAVLLYLEERCERQRPTGSTASAR